MVGPKIQPSPGLYLLSSDEFYYENEALLLCLKCCQQCSNVEFPVQWIDRRKVDVIGSMDCGLPCVVSQSGCVHSGLTACVRQIVLLHTSEFDKYKTDLLGYHDNCLRSCAEVSPWTYLCEYTLPEIAENLHKRGRDFVSSLELHFENGLRLPSVNNARKSRPLHPLLKFQYECTSDIEKQMLALNLRIVERKFIDHTSVTILDLLIFALVLRIPSRYLESLPKVEQWFNRMWTVPAVKIAASERGYAENFPVIPGDDEFEFSNNDYTRLFERKTKNDHMKYGKHGCYDASPVLRKLISAGISPFCKLPEYYEHGKIDWDLLPKAVHPQGGHLPLKRLARKIGQLDNLVQAVLALARDGDTIVDFCSGGGHLGLVLAYLRPKCHVIMIENKETSLRCALERAKDQKLENTTFYQCNLTKFTGRFDIGVSLHACGSATDLVLDQCLRSEASFVLCPCCYGSIKGSDHGLSYPRSKTFRSALNKLDYEILSHAADQTEFSLELAETGRQCMNFVDWDRCLLAEQNGYETFVTSLIPPECTPKNSVIIGAKSRSLSA